MNINMNISIGNIITILKNRKIRILNIATDTESLKDVIVYEELYGEFNIKSILLESFSIINILNPHDVIDKAEEREILLGKIYKHFKDKPYKTIAITTDTVTGEKFLLYQAMYFNNGYKTYIRPYSMFVSEVDKVKYPDVIQRYRFELMAEL